ncbi:hypothetical protein PCC9214_04714 [Planktothrix tepida]|uniref:Uncharacterized protein n=1 Tax=Planktothrix tepida PCC 9214 TaxID=671072 RepID=A0A1J1LMA3_9CYAN|nr:hypothetical protein [Planktothrix tepida]CAD5980855.1 hypothetical protein PCC9214_04714 [Planktothrix tepida]CUR33701.1 conserved hypothetical protein [Planktothrix tepida PCC 9214]
MRKNVVLQILGNNDVRVDSEQGTSQLGACYTLEDVRDLAADNDQELGNDLDRIDFPLIRNLWESRESDTLLHFVILLTNQQAWIEYHHISGQELSDLITSDGYWWRNLLQAWCQKLGIPHDLIILDIDPNLDNGVANWDQMAKFIEEQLNPKFAFNSKGVVFENTSDRPKINAQKLIVQHSSGTPALSGALYLWGLEQQLAKNPIDFVYMSRQDSQPYFHTGTHWQWRLKVPQIEQLLEIQDFLGVKTLIQDHPDNTLKTKLEQLDRAVSFNLSAKRQKLSAEEDILERIAIALWSEKAFRERGQWMQWYLRIAGSFELAIACLVQHQGGNAYHWERDHKTQKPILKYQEKNQNYIEFRLDISPTVKNLLSEGNGYNSYLQKTYITNKINDPAWKSFKDFYCSNWIRISDHSKSFLEIRNELYHSLLGDLIDQILDEKTKQLKGVNHADHPAQIAIDWLNYIVKLANLTTPINSKIKEFEQLVNDVKRSL